MSEHAIEVNDAKVTYAGGKEAVRGVTFHVERGEFFGFLGPNGAGKSTTIKLLTTLLHPTGGSVRVLGRDPTREPVAIRERIGYMAQETSVDDILTARENVRYAAQSYGVPRGKREAKVDELLRLVDLVDVADKTARTFSGGMKKRLDIATSLVHDPELLFLDEPTTGLDPKARLDLWAHFRALNERGTTIFLTTQYLEEADQLCDRVAILSKGRIVAVGTPAELKASVGKDALDVHVERTSPDAPDRARKAIEHVLQKGDQVGTTEDGLAITSPRARRLSPEVVVALRDAGLTVTSLNVRSPTLDDVFLHYTGSTLEQAQAAMQQGASA
jgi:ABC-2 type transport system ATP-binding protein